MSETSHHTNISECEFHANSAEVPQTRRFRFKEKAGSPLRHRVQPHSTRHSPASHDGRRRHSRPHRRKRQKTTSPPTEDASSYDASLHSLPPEAAFRESLFDAMADDEGAAFWEGVYGQPIHNYPSRYVDPQTGKLEQMNDEEYAEYVRRKMWEKSWEGIEAEREERRKAEKAEERSRREEDGKRDSRAGLQNGRLFDFEVEESLRRGEQRRERKRWKTLWDDYQKRWANLQQWVEDKSQDSEAGTQVFVRDRIAWPVESGKRDDLLPLHIETFLVNGTKHATPDLDREVALQSALKAERVRWHPDKIQQRFGNWGIDDTTMKGVTAVFQVIDRMWNERKGQK